MVGRDRSHSDRGGGRTHAGWWRTGAPVVLVAVLLALAVAAYALDLGTRLGIAPNPQQDPAAVAPPPGLDLPSVGAAGPVAAPLGGHGPVPADVRRAIGRLPDARKLGKQVGVLVADSNGHDVYRHGPRVVTPASTMKLLTTLAALHVLGPEHRFTTQVVGRGRHLTLVGGGDPLLGSRPEQAGGYPPIADVRTLAAETARALHKENRLRIRLAYDDSLFKGPSVSPDWQPDYVTTDVVSPISALWTDEGRVAPGDAARVADPAKAAAQDFARALQRDGVKVVGQPAHAKAPQGAARVAAVRSAPLAEIVEHVLEWSDNEGAEVLARQVALAEGRPATFHGGADAVKAVDRSLGVPLASARMLDGSGLSRHDRVPVQALVDALAVAAHHAPLSVVLESLPVAGFSGSLDYRFQHDATSGLGRVRAKTGTLTGVHALAGVVTGRDGSVMLFAAVADRVHVRNTLWARDRLDQIAAALAGCSCGS